MLEFKGRATIAVLVGGGWSASRICYVLMTRDKGIGQVPRAAVMSDRDGFVR